MKSEIFVRTPPAHLIAPKPLGFGHKQKIKEQNDKSKFKKKGEAIATKAQRHKEKLDTNLHKLALSF